MVENSLLFIHGQGLRENNEDAYYHGKISDDMQFFIVCDGVGGTQKGEVASSLACRAIDGYIQNNKLSSSSSSYEKYINDMIKFVDSEFERYFLSDPQAKGMGTTLALLILTGNWAIAVHIGDSRIFHVRKNTILFETRDHSLANSLMDNGIITKEEVENYPWKNVITRALQGKSVKPGEADIHVIPNVQPGDYFFLCSDGILEGIKPDELLLILNSDITDEEKIVKIKERCEDRSKDNYTAILVPL